MLEVHALFGGYGRKQVVFDINFHLRTAEIVTILGHNGAGKTTTLKTVFGVLPIHRGKVTFQDRDISHATCRQNVLSGLSLIPSERFVFGDLTVIDNLRLGGLYEKSSQVRAERLQRVYSMFPILNERSTQLARTMSGGEQRMLSLGVAIMAGPKLLMLDEPSLGLAPVLVEQLFASIRNLADEEGLTVLLLEQNVGQALRITDRVYVMRSGRIILEETADQMRERDQYWDLF
jgi:branched-chain amino acid transport system ATP-binding protein